MAWNFTGEKPIYAQIAERLKIDILSGKYRAGTKLPTVRELAEEAAVNPNTVQKAFAQLEQDGLISTQRTAGRTVTMDQKILRELREKLQEELTREYLGKMASLGCYTMDAVKLIEKIEEGNFST